MTDTGSGKFDLPMIGGGYRLGSKIGSGSSGVSSQSVQRVFLNTHYFQVGIDIRTGLEVAIKLQSANARYPQLEHESRVYKALRGLIGMPLFLWYGLTGYGHNALVLELLGSSLEDLFNLCNHKFTLKTVLLLADQMVCRSVIISFVLGHTVIRFLISSIFTLKTSFIAISRQKTSIIRSLPTCPDACPCSLPTLE